MASYCVLNLSLPVVQEVEHGPAGLSAARVSSSELVLKPIRFQVAVFPTD